jgi:autotransporter-associated beta strand protein
MGNASALGGASGTVVVTNGGTLDVNGNSLEAEPVMVSGWGVNSNGAIVSTSASAQDNALENVTLNGSTAFGGPGNWLTSGNPGRWDIRGSGTTLTMSGGAPFNLYKTGSNQVSIVGVTVDTNLATIDIQQGMMGFEDGSTSMGNPAGNLIVRAGATLEFYQSSAPSNSYTKQFVLFGNGATATITNWPGGGSSTIFGQMTLNGACLIGVNGTSFTNNCTIVGTGSLTKSGAQPLTLGGKNTYTGGSVIGSGFMILSGNGSISDSTKITVNLGATLDASGRGDTTLTLANGQTLNGKGTVKGNVIVGSGATLAPGNSLGTLTFSNNLTLNGGSKTVMEINKSAAPSNDVAQVTGNLLYGGTLVITNLGTNAFSAGDSFKLFNAAVYNGAFTNIVPAIPAVNLAWNTNSLTNGVLSIVAAPTPPPKFGGLNFSGGNLVFSGTSGVPGWTYYVLASTNMASPLSQWQRIATNPFDGNGNFNFTNPPNPNAPQTFYLLEMP